MDSSPALLVSLLLIDWHLLFTDLYLFVSTCQIRLQDLHQIVGSIFGPAKLAGRFNERWNHRAGVLARDSWDISVRSEFSKNVQWLWCEEFLYDGLFLGVYTLYLYYYFYSFLRHSGHSSNKSNSSTLY